MIAIPLLFGRLTAATTKTGSPPIRASMHCAPRWSASKTRIHADYHDPEKRSIANSLRVELNDGTVIEETVEYPIGHRRRREEGMPLLVEKFKTNLRRRFTDEQQHAHSRSLARSPASDEMPVNEFCLAYVDLCPLNTRATQLLLPTSRYLPGGEVPLL
jgi:2-methylcitrate dehydratase